MRFVRGPEDAETSSDGVRSVLGNLRGPRPVRPEADVLLQKVQELGISASREATAAAEIL
jgi:hypothetical protein